MPAKSPSRSREPTDHRTRVGRERRARTRQRIVEAALDVFAEKGPDVPVIEDFIQAAGVARGTFYGHFRTTEELLTATSSWLENDLMTAIDSVNGGFEDPVQRLANGIRLWLELSRGDEVFCAFVVRSRFRGRIVEQHIARDLDAGLRSGQLVAPSLELARDLIVGTVREAQLRMMQSRVRRALPDSVARLILQAFRVDDQRIDALLQPLPALHRKPRVGSARGAVPAP